MNGIDHLGELHRFQDEFLATIPRVDPRAPVAACAPWRARDLVVHLARIHHWAAGRARRTREAPLGRGPFDLAELYGRCAGELRATLGELDPAARAWTLVGPGPVAFWHRRQLHETLVHLWDLRAAGGLDADAPPAVWRDTVDEVATVFQPRQVRLGRTSPLVRGVRLVADGVPDDRSGDGRPSEPSGDGGPRQWLLGAHQPSGPPAGVEVTVTGPAKALALLVWRRLTPDEAGLRIEGDPAALTAALSSAALTP